MEKKQVCEEIDGLFNGSDRPVTLEDLSELKYLECCIKESLRLYPSVPFFARKLSQDISIGLSTKYTVYYHLILKILDYFLFSRKRDSVWSYGCHLALLHPARSFSFS